MNAAITINNQFWKVGDGLPFVNPGTVKAVSIVGGDIYTGGGLITWAGNVSAAFTAYAAKCWKNGVLLPIQDSASSWLNKSFINAMAVNGNDVYVAGYNNKGCAYWKNGVPVSLPDGRSVSGIVVIGNDVYVSGTGIGPGKNTAVYWKNGTQIQLSDSSYLSTGAEATGITAINNDIYICGSETYSNIYIGGTRFNYTYSKIWKNGIPLTISKRDANNNTTGIFVKP